MVRAVAWDPIGPEFKPRWDTELIYIYIYIYKNQVENTRRLTQPVILPRSAK